jgi:hypothetical protein
MTLSRPQCVALALVALVLLPATPGIAQRHGVPEDLAEANHRAVARGLEYLAKTQNRDGGWYSDVGFKLNESYTVTTKREGQMLRGGGHVGVTALAGMSFMAGGNLPGRGKYGRNLEDALNYVLANVKEDGYITDSGTRMYSHAFATLFLAEIYGMTHREDVQVKLQMAVDLIVKSQNKWGSWRYLPFAPDSDMSITVCQIMALRAARNIGIRVPRSTIDRAIQYVVRSAYETGPDRGGFKYQLRDDQPTRTSFSLTAAGITTLYGAGVYSHDLIEEGLDYLKREYYSLSDMRDHYFYFYGHYYAVQAMYIAGSKHWEWYWPRIQTELIRDQLPDGSWKNNVSPEFGTAVATLILQIPNDYLPIFQR